MNNRLNYETFCCRFLLMSLMISTLSGFSSANSSTAEEQRQLIIAFNDFPPYAIEKGLTIPPNDTIGCTYPRHLGYGIDPDFLSSVLNHAGIPYKRLFLPYARIKTMLNQGELDASAGFFYSELNGQPKYRYILYDIGGATMFYAKGSQAEKLTELKQLFSLKLGIVRGEAFHHTQLDQWIYKTKTLKPAILANSYKQLFRLLDADRVDVIAANNVVGGYLIKTMNLQEIKFSPLRLDYGQDPQVDGIHIALRRDIPRVIYEKLQTSTETLLQQGVFRCIQQKYGVISNN